MAATTSIYVYSINALNIYNIYNSILGKTCTVKNLARDGSDVLFGYLSQAGIPHIFNTAGALHYMKSAGQVL